MTKDKLLGMIWSQRQLFVLNRLSLIWTLVSKEKFLEFELTINGTNGKNVVLQASDFAGYLNNPNIEHDLIREHEVNGKRILFNSVFETVSSYTEQTGQQSIFQAASWYPYLYVMRVFGAHYLKDKDLDAVKNFKKKGRGITWRGKTITEINEKNIVGLNLPEALELVDDLIEFIKNELR